MHDSVDSEIFDDIDMSELDLVDVEIVRTSSVMGIPETGASCCTIFSCGSCACSSCYADEQPTLSGTAAG
jgi:hypothetical protein